jgi:hypothetical protein
MPAPTVSSSSYSVMGAPNKDGSQFVRSTFVISGGSTQNIDQPNVPAGTDLNANLTTLVASVNATLAIVPTPVALYQAHQAVINAGLQSEVDAAVAAASAQVQNLWYASESIDRYDPNLIALGTQLGLTSDQLDDLFRAAAVL